MAYYRIILNKTLYIYKKMIYNTHSQTIGVYND
jgi:hypothetical protein